MSKVFCLQSFKVSIESSMDGDNLSHQHRMKRQQFMGIAGYLSGLSMLESAHGEKAQPECKADGRFLPPLFL